LRFKHARAAGHSGIAAQLGLQGNSRAACGDVAASLDKDIGALLQTFIQLEGEFTEYLPGSCRPEAEVWQLKHLV
jgi:hypothetical protein